MFPEAGVPIERRRQLQFFQREAVDLVPRQLLRRGLQRGQAPVAEHVAPVRGEHLVRLPLLGLDVPGLEQQAAVAALRVDALLLQGALDGGVARLGRRLVLAVPVHRLGAGFLDQCLQRGQALTAAQYQRRTARAQVGIECGQRTMAPGIRRRAGRPLALFLRRMDIDRHHIMAGIERGLQGRIVLQPQIAAEPHQRYRHVHRLRSGWRT